ncbi:MAG: hypothetical protein ACQEXE_04005 [Bacillota bacterium]
MDKCEFTGKRRNGLTVLPDQWLLSQEKDKSTPIEVQNQKSNPIYKIGVAE